MATTTEKFSFFRRKTKTRTFNNQAMIELNLPIEINEKNFKNFEVPSQLNLRDIKSSNYEYLRHLSRIT